MRYHGKAPIAAGLLASLVLLAGCGGTRGVLFEPPAGGAAGGGGGAGGGVQPGDTQVPTLANATATLPAGFRWTGGNVTLQIDATDVSGIKSVTAAATRRKTGAVSQVALAANAAPTYAGAFNAPANVNNDGTAERYDITFTATDNAGNQSTATASFAVPAAVAPQVPPVL